ncbi:DMT family transporter [Phenylobacterium sp. J367]|uniref:DMT family transporter n=1 Tax=Phenylobacterium sp. J367 TaxID=2898435 RepID=UPI00215077D5|nr:DMT family transporter [Phenylobacterium sp. J367]MCR5881002.1 DMT family transporter [Phenylobacterium sp. J367]
MSPRDLGLMVMVCLIWAANNVLSKYVVSGLNVPPLAYAGLRFAVVLLCVFPWLFPAPRPLWRIVVVGLLMGGANFALLFVGLKTATPSSAAVVLQLGIPMSILLSVLLLGERIRWRRGLGIALTFAGAMTVMWDPHGFAISTGLLLVAAAAFGGSLGSVLMKQLEGVKPLQYQAWVGFTSLLPLTLLSAVFEPGQVEKVIAAGWPFLGALLFSALIVSLFAHSLFYVLVQRHEANLVSALTLMTPLATIALGVAVMNDPFGPRMAIGSAVALVGVLIIALRGNQVWPMLLAIRNRAQ